MEKTTHYELNQWAGEDRIMRVDFNADNQKLDAALYQQAQTQAAQTAALTTEQQTRAAEDTAIRQAFAAADTAERQTAAAETAAVQQSLNSQTAAIRSEMAAGDVAVAGQIALVKLATIVTQQAVTQVDIDLSGYGTDQYAEFYIIPNILDTSSVYVRVNGLLEGYPSSRNYLAKCYGSTSSLFCTLRIIPTDRINCVTEEDVTYINAATLAPSGLKTLNFFTINNDTRPAGCKFLLYGGRK